MKVTLSKALKLKNRQSRLVGELQRRISTVNSYLQGSEPEFDAKALYEQLKAETNRLIAIKAAINGANATVQGDIYRMAELKGIAQFVRALNTQRGKVIVGYMASEPQEYVAQINAADATAEVERIEKEIDALQDGLDGHNATTTIELDVPE
ncbi:MAG: hypothetical protein ACHQ50_08590 [Fimbriimonadales bacterium]